jgi:AraC-like DNA-binding protein
MAERPVSRLRRMPSAMGLVSRLAYARARGRKAALRTALARSGFTAQQLEDVRARLSSKSQIEFLNRLSEVLDDDQLGFNLAMDFDPRQAGLVYYVMASSDSLQEVFARAARFGTLVNESVVQKRLEGRQVGLSMHYSGVRRLADRHQIEFWTVALLRICRQLTGRHLRPARIRLMHFRARGNAALARFAGCEVEFGAAADEIVFAPEVRKLRVVHADPYLSRLLLEICERTLVSRRRGPHAFIAHVENVLAPLLPHGRARAAEVARRLGLSQRTFARRLASEGTTFSKLLHGLRLELARRYLVQEKLAISKVAWLLGYQEVGAFSHAFRRWTGKTPSSLARRA